MVGNGWSLGTITQIVYRPVDDTFRRVGRVVDDWRLAPKEMDSRVLSKYSADKWMEAFNRNAACELRPWPNPIETIQMRRMEMVTWELALPEAMLRSIDFEERSR